MENAKFIKNHFNLIVPDNKLLITKLKKRKIDFHNVNSCNLFNKETPVSGKTEELLTT